MNWSDVPDFTTVKDTLKKRASIKAELRIAELNLLIAESQYGKPRNKASRLVGNNEDEQRILYNLNMHVIQLRNQLDDVDADVEILNYHKEIFKSLSYKG